MRDLTILNIATTAWRTISGMNPQLLASAFFLQRLHGAAFAASFLEDYDVSRERAFQLLADRPPERLLPVSRGRAQYPNQMENSDTRE